MIDLKHLFKTNLGRGTIVKLLTGLDRRHNRTDEPSGQVSLVLEYIPLAIEKNEVTLQVKTQLAVRNTPLLKQHQYREDIGSLKVTTHAESLEDWYVLLADAVMDHLSEQDHSNLNGVAQWLLPHYRREHLKLALN